MQSVTKVASYIIISISQLFVGRIKITCFREIHFFIVLPVYINLLTYFDDIKHFFMLSSILFKLNIYDVSNE